MGFLYFSLVTLHKHWLIYFVAITKPTRALTARARAPCLITSSIIIDVHLPFTLVPIRYPIHLTH